MGGVWSFNGKYYFDVLMFSAACFVIFVLYVQEAKFICFISILLLG